MSNGARAQNIALIALAGALAYAWESPLPLLILFFMTAGEV